MLRSTEGGCADPISSPTWRAMPCMLGGAISNVADQLHPAPCATGNVVAIMTAPTPLLDAISSPADLRRLDERQLLQVVDELRAETINAVAVTGGHLGAGL